VQGRALGCGPAGSSSLMFRLFEADVEKLLTPGRIGWTLKRALLVCRRDGQPETREHPTLQSQAYASTRNLTNLMAGPNAALSSFWEAKWISQITCDRYHSALRTSPLRDKSIMVPLSGGPRTHRCVKTLCLIALLPLVIPFTSCSNSCGSFESKPGGTLTVSSPCMLHVTQVFTGGQIAPQCESCSPSNQLQNVVITLRGIQVHPRTDRGEAPADWQELVPVLNTHARQFELGRTGANSFAPTPLGESAEIPAGSYDLIRLLLATNPGRDEDRVAAENKCGSVGPNCAVMGDGRILPLTLKTDALQLRISREGSPDGVFSVLPDRENHLLIELNAVWSLDARAGEGGRLSLVLQGNARKNE